MTETEALWAAAVEDFKQLALRPSKFSTARLMLAVPVPAGGITKAAAVALLSEAGLKSFSNFSATIAQARYARLQE